MAKKEDKALMIPNTLADYAIMNVDENLAELMAENLGGEELGMRDLEIVKVPSGGGIAWTVINSEGEEDSCKEIKGIIIAAPMTRAYWSTSFTGASTPPDCLSDDCKTGIGNPGGECKICPLNEFESAGLDANGNQSKAKACKENRLIFFIAEDSLLPKILKVPPMSLEASKKYLIDLFAKHKKAKNQVITSFTLKGGVNSGGLKYSEIVFSKAEDLAPEAYERVKEYSKSFGNIGLATATKAAAQERDTI